MALRGAVGRGRGTNLARVKDYNEVIVLDHVRRAGPVGRAAIAAATGLTLQTVSNISRRLLVSGTIVETPLGDARGLRVLEVNADGGFALGIQFLRTAVVVGVVDLAGTVRGMVEGPVAPGEGPDAVLARLPGLVEDVLEQSEVPRERLLGAGVGAPGPLDLRDGSLLDLQTPRSWSHFPLRRAVREAIGLEVILDNDASAAAMGERWRGAGAGCENFVYVYLGAGVGSGLVLRGQPYRGLRGNAGEIAHLQVEPLGPPCECGRNGCLGLYVSAAGLLREARRVALEAPPTAPIARTPATLEELLSSDEPRMTAVVARAGAYLAGVMAEMTRVLDPELIVLGGPLLTLLGDGFASELSRRLGELEEPGAPAPRVELSRIGSGAGVIGAATLILHDLYAPSARKLDLEETPAGAGASGRRRRAA
jgi:predicted NBD/HSP70 family sugar kinase